MTIIKHLGHSSFMIKEKNILIYIDPYNIEQKTKADIILITHGHFDHCSQKDIEKISGSNTRIFCPPDCKHKLSGNIEVMLPGMKKEIKKISIESVPAYNTNKSFHPKANGWLGYIINVNGIRIYHAGDTDFILEMETLGKIDYALLPVGGKYTMDAKEAANAAKKICPRIAVPMHYGSIVGDISDAELFKKLCSCRVEYLGCKK